MLYFDKTDISEGIDINKTSASKEYIRHYWYFLNFSPTFQQNVCNRCHDSILMSMNLIDITISNIKGSNYCCIISLISKNKAIILIQNADLMKKSREL